MNTTLTAGFGCCLADYPTGVARTETLLQLLQTAGIKAKLSLEGAYCPGWRHIEIPTKDAKRAQQLASAYTIGIYQAGAEHDATLFQPAVNIAIETFPR